MTLGHFWYRGD